MSAFEKAYILNSQQFRNIEDKEILAEFRKLWAKKELGNDVYYSWVDPVDDEGFKDFAESYPKLAAYIADNHPEPELGTYLHFWW